MSGTKQDQWVKREETVAPTPSATYLPDVDIVENGDHIRLLADLPGVSQDGVEVTVENNVLTLHASASVTAPEGCRLVGQEYGIGDFHRDFALTDAVEVEGITAKVKHGVLEVVIPKREEIKTRRIRIES